MNSRPVCGRSSETRSHAIDMNNMNRNISQNEIEFGEYKHANNFSIALKIVAIHVVYSFIMQIIPYLHEHKEE
jgi:hypothetical protein